MQRLILCALLALAVPVEPTWTDIVSRIEKGSATSDATLLRSAMTDATRLADVTGFDRERELALYGSAYAAWRLSALPGETPADAAAVLSGAEKSLHEAIKMNPQSGEARALLATVLGSLIRFGGNKMTLGPDSQAARDEAIRLEPNNPRVLLQSAITIFHTPVEYGGSPERAEAELRRAVSLFEREPANRPWPNWGRFDAHVWLGQVLAARGDKDGARTEYNLALAVWPASSWVTHILIPALNK